MFENQLLRHEIEQVRELEIAEVKMKAICSGGILCDYEDLHAYLEHLSLTSCASLVDLIHVYCTRLLKTPELVREEVEQFKNKNEKPQY